MNINISIDCTPEEARRFMGLPDVEQANRIYMDQLTSIMKGATSTEQMQDIARQLAPMGQMGLKLFQGLMETGSAFASGVGAPAKDGTKS